MQVPESMQKKDLYGDLQQGLSNVIIGLASTDHNNKIEDFFGVQGKDDADDELNFLLLPFV